MDTKDINSPFQDWLKTEMDKRGWTMAELARRAGVHQSAVGQVVNRRKALGVKLASAFAAALDIPEDIVFEVGDSSHKKEKNQLLQKMNWFIFSGS